MKMFLMTSMIAMLTAGIFGAVDLAKDLKNGTMIEYNDEVPPADVVEVSSFYIDESEFSRGEPGPPPVMEEEVAKEEAKTEQLKEEAPVQKVTTGVKKKKVGKVVEKKKEEAAVVPEKRKLDMKLYSRGRPPKREKENITIEESEAKDELVAVKVDSVKNE